MTKKIYSICMAVALLVAGVAMSGCKKDNNNPDQPKQVQTYKMSIQASKGTDRQANGPRRVLSLEGTTLNATWQAGEQVTVYNETQNAELGGYLEAEESGASTQLNGTLTGSIAVGDELTLKYLSANYTGQNGTLTYISANCDYATASVTVATVAGGEITTTADADFVNQQAIVKFTLKDAADHTTLLSPTALTFNDGTADIATLTIPAATYTTNGAGVLYVAVPGFSGKNITLTATVGSDTYAFEKANTTLTNGQYYILTVEMTKQVPEGAINGKFSVGPAGNNKQVYFSKGNLQYVGTWQFADNQWDYFGTSQSNNHRDLFGWGTNGTSDHNPNNTSKINSEYSWAEWGTNPITNGGNKAGLWRTLTKDEWVYLLETRAGAQAATVNGIPNIRFAKATVNNVKGIILFPDGGTFAASEFTAVGSPNTGDANYTTTCTTAQWNALQAAGCVFLPAAGLRSGTTVNDAGASGYYWSSSASSNTSAYPMGFLAGSLYPEFNNDRYAGFSVRLVKNAN